MARLKQSLQLGSIVFGTVFLMQCGVFVSVGDVRDSSTDVPTRREIVIDTSVDASDVTTDDGSWRDGDELDGGSGDDGDGGGGMDASEVGSDAMAADVRVCAIPAGPILPNTNQSCRGANGAPLEHCREVWQCGGPFTMGSTDAWIRNGFGQPWRRQTACDLSRGDVHPGYIDAYPVSVARFRAFVRAGQPQPPVGTVLFDSYRWPAGARGTYVPATPSICTYRDAAGENDSLPMNCVQFESALAFCFWDGKHHATAAAWEFVATNGGRSPRPFVVADGFDPCEFGDVLPRRCRARNIDLPLPIAAFPQGQTFDPPGVFGLWGNVSVGMFAVRGPSCGAGFIDGWRIEETGHTRGIGTDFFSDYEHMQYSASTDFVVNGGPGIGIRCMRWIPESR